ncbi:MAG TPA: 50S ribosomal protein L24 [Candidatus Saccharimonadales bacterium]|nr:50S ribosomal protein L24 [Candidatus Saccharimonadales bacterium]
MTAIKRIIKGDTVKIISGANKGTTGKVLGVLTKQNAVLVEGIGNIHRKVKPSQQNPRGGHKDIHVPTPIHKVALVIDEKTSRTSRVGLIKNQEGIKTRVARQNNNKEIK